MNTAPETYIIRVDGHLDDHWSAWLGDADITREDDGTTILNVLIADQAQLHGVLAGLRDIGAAITELRTTGAPVPNCRNSTGSFGEYAISELRRAHADLQDRARA